MAEVRTVFQSTQSSRPSRPLPSLAPLGELPIAGAAAASGVSAKMIRYDAAIGLVRPAARSTADDRTYDAAAVQTLRSVARARGPSFGMDELAGLLAPWRDPMRSSAEVKAVVPGHVADLDALARALHGMEAALRNLAHACHGDARPDCSILDKYFGNAPRSDDA